MITAATTADRHRREIHACGDGMTIEAATEETERAATEAFNLLASEVPAR